MTETNVGATTNSSANAGKQDDVSSGQQQEQQQEQEQQQQQEQQLGLPLCEHVSTTHVIKEATCTENGEEYYECNNCHTKLGYKVITATGKHSYKDDGHCKWCDAEQPKPEG